MGLFCCAYLSKRETLGMSRSFNILKEVMAMAVLKIDGNNFEPEVLKSNQPVLVDFWASWCGPCRMVAPVVEEMADAYDGRLKVGKLNVDENQDIASRYQVMSIPTLVMFKDGVEVNRVVGFRGKPHLQQFIDAEIK
jgi:thioredoxin 1